jgi:hypothetical protein
MVQISRGYEDERLILSIFLMFANKADSFGRFGNLSSTDEDFKLAHISEADLRVLLMSI